MTAKQHKEGQLTNFGFEKVTSTEKTQLVSSVFESVASQYDLMNDLMSGGMHRFWKYFSMERCHLKEGHRVLDIASGTGDLAKKIAAKIGKTGELTALDLQIDMLKKGRDNLIDAGFLQNITYIQGNAESLPFPDNYYDCLTIGFGLRNVSNLDKALSEMKRVLKPGGKLMILEFSSANSKIKDLYKSYSFNIIPKVGGFVTGDEKSYQYLVESILMHPDQELLMSMIQEAKFDSCYYENMSLGIVAMHMAYK